MEDPFAAINKAREDYQKLVREEGDKAMKDMLKQFFEKHKYAQAIGWTQYTPYFNDGDECVFGIGEVRVRVDPEIRSIVDKYAGEEVEEWADADNLYEAFIETYSLEESELKNDMTAIQNTIWGNSDVMLEAFGDHAKVIATPAEITVNFYDHD